MKTSEKLEINKEEKKKFFDKKTVSVKIKYKTIFKIVLIVIVFVVGIIVGFNISGAYLITDVIVLMLSLTYIPFGRIIFSLITTTGISFSIIDSPSTFIVLKSDVHICKIL